MGCVDGQCSWDQHRIVFIPGEFYFIVEEFVGRHRIVVVSCWVSYFYILVRSAGHTISILVQYNGVGELLAKPRTI